MKVVELNKIVKGITARVVHRDCEISTLLTDSRKLGTPEDSLFFAIDTKRNSGTRFVKELYDKGVRNFVLPQAIDDNTRQSFEALPDANLFYVKHVVRALQQVVGFHRKGFDIPVVGITGSNGKTIVKDWIVQLLSEDRKTVSSPKSYNSQIGVPLSVWQMQHGDEIAIFEAGVSVAGEMEHLRDVIQPTIGIFTNVGQAHDEGFLTRNQKVAEKLQLFVHCGTLIYCSDHKDIHATVAQQESFRSTRRFTWGKSADNDVQLLSTHVGDKQTTLRVRYQGRETTVAIPFTDLASAENAMHCISLMLLLGYDGEEVAKRCARLTPVAMRLEMDEGINDCLLINDGYSLDINSLTIALDVVQHERRHQMKTLIMSDFLQSGRVEQELYEHVALLMKQRGIGKFVGIGEALCRNQEVFKDFDARFFTCTEEFLRKQPFAAFHSETILIKGARVFHFEDIAKVLQRKSHETIMEINLNALVNNLNYYRSRINPTTKLMAMVKASSYGTGKVEIASVLQFNHVDYLTVAYSDEGVDLRRNGITLPIMVMNPEEEGFDDIIKYQMEPDIYSFRILEEFSKMAALYGTHGDKIKVHIELDTGMHRLGFSGADIERLVACLTASDSPLQVCSIFSHLACSEDPTMDHFTRRQIELFTQWSSQLKEGLGNPNICCHILNSSGITRFPEAQMDMVRLGIGLYGISPEEEVQRQLTPIAQLKTKVSQVKQIPQGDSVGYNRRWIAQHDSQIAIIPIGYADGLNRRLGYGRGKVMIGGHEVPIIGSICMDMCFVDVTGIPCNEGDEVVIFGNARLLHQMSEASDTIPYEILTTVAPRVKRVYYQE